MVPEDDKKEEFQSTVAHVNQVIHTTDLLEGWSVSASAGTMHIYQRKRITTPGAAPTPGSDGQPPSAHTA